MRLKNVLIVVKDIEKSKKFYNELFGLSVILDQGENVILTEGLVLQEAKVWEEAIKQEVCWKNHATELYFEEQDIEAFVEKLSAYSEEICLINSLTKDSFGKRTIRFYDPDGNLVEVGTKV